MVSVAVSIQMRKMFVDVRKIFSNARHAEQDVLEGRLVSTGYGWCGIRFSRG